LTPTPPVESEEIVTEEVAVRVPVVNLPMDDEAKNESTNRPMFANREVEVALVPVAFVNVKFWSVVDPETVRATALKRDVVAFPSISTEPEKSPLPETESAADGEVVPKPRYPAALITLVRFPDELYISKMLAV